jgi:hypothetical protein
VPQRSWTLLPFVVVLVAGRAFTLDRRQALLQIGSSIRIYKVEMPW